MIIRCTQCSTEFDLDPRQVGPEGVTLRCSVCSHMFHAEPEPEGEGVPQTWRLATVEKHLFELRTLREVVEHVLDGRLRPDDQISQTGQHWLKLGEIPEFSALFIGHDLPRVYKAIEAAVSELGPPPTFGTGVDEPAPVRREETVRFNLGSLHEPLPEPALPTIDDDGPVPAPPQFDSPAPRNSRAQRVTGGVSSMLDAVTKAVTSEAPPPPPPQRDEDDDDDAHDRRRGRDKDRPTGSVRGRSQPILVSDLARAAAQSVAATVQRVDDQRATERSERVGVRDRNEPSEGRVVREEPTPRSERAATAAAVAAAVAQPVAAPPVAPAPAPVTPAVASPPAATTAAVSSAASGSGSSPAPAVSSAVSSAVSAAPPRTPEVVIVKVAEPATSRGSVMALVAVLLGVGVVFGIPNVRERVFNLGSPSPPAAKPETKPSKVEQLPEFQAARQAMRTLGVRETTRAIGGLERVIDDTSKDPAVITTAKLAQAELMLLRVLANQITIMLEPGNSQAQGAIDTDLPDAGSLVESLPEDADPGVRARVAALLGVAQGKPDVKLAADVPGAREVQALILGAPLWRSRDASVPSGLITSLRGVSNPSTLHQSLLALALWRSGDDEGARTVLDGVLGRVGDMLAAKALRAALDQQAAEKGEVLPPPPEPPPEPVDPTGATPTEPRPADPNGTGVRPPPTRPQAPSATEQDTIDVLIRTGCEKVRNNDASGGNKLLMQAVDKRGDWRHFELCMCLGTGFSAQNNHDTALAWFKRAAAQSPSSRDAIAGVARAAELAGKKLDAIEYYRKLLEIEPGNQPARNYLAKHDESGKTPPPEDLGELMPVSGKK